MVTLPILTAATCQVPMTSLAGSTFSSAAEEDGWLDPELDEPLEQALSPNASRAAITIVAISFVLSLNISVPFRVPVPPAFLIADKIVA